MHAPFGFQPHVLRDEAQRADLATRANVDIAEVEQVRARRRVRRPESLESARVLLCPMITVTADARRATGDRRVA
jgi:hypothetical protein